MDGSPESLARQQLMAELREASNLMAESVTPEAAKFWRNHVVELQARLRALHGESSAQANTNTGSGLSAEEILRNNERLLRSIEAEYEGSSGYVPPDQYQQKKQAPLSSALRKRQEAFDPKLAGVPMVDVVSPADLPGGYMFEAEIDDRRFLATVPAGGVRKGETFSCYMRDLEKVGSEIPIGRWRDSITDCFAHGLCHPVVWNSLLCPLRKSFKI